MGQFLCALLRSLTSLSILQTHVFLLASSSGNDGDEVEGSASDAVMKYSDQTTQVSGPLGGGIIKSSARSGFGVELVNVSPTKGGITATGKEGDENENAASQPVVATTQHEQLMQNESVRKFLACSRYAEIASFYATNGVYR